MLLRIESDLRWTSQARFHLEVGFVKLARVGYVRDIEEVLSEVKGGGSNNPSPRPPRAPAVTTARPTAPAQAPPAPAPPRQSEKKPNPAAAIAPESISFADIFTRRAEDKSPTTAVYLQKADLIERNSETVRILVSNTTVLAMLQSKEHKSVLDAAATELVGKPVSVSLIMKETQQKNGPAAETAKDEPLVQRFLQVFRGDLAQVKPAKED